MNSILKIISSHSGFYTDLLILTNVCLLFLFLIYHRGSQTTPRYYLSSRHTVSTLATTKTKEVGELFEIRGYEIIFYNAGDQVM